MHKRKIDDLKAQKERIKQNSKHETLDEVINKTRRLIKQALDD